jgi:ubiquinone/menaquinone biosynthesis C-methylase UbiE
MPKKKRKQSWIRRLERLGMNIAMRHDLLGAKVIKGENDKVSRLYDFWAPVYDLMFRRLESFRMGGERLVDAVVERGDCVLDMGAGTGLNLEPIFRRTNQVHALDLHPKMLRTCQRLAKKHRIRPQLVHGSAVELPYRDECFDSLITAYMMVYLTPEQSVSCLKECVRVLKTGGRMGILCGAGERSPRNPLREEWVEQLYAAGFRRVDFDDFYDVLRVVRAEK